MSIRLLDTKPFSSSHQHDHFWERAFSRRKMLGLAAGAGAAVVGGSLLKGSRATAETNGSDPRPIPHGIMVDGQGWHVDGPGPDIPILGGAASVPGSVEFSEMSTVYDFEGAVAAFVVQGTGTGRQGGAVLPLAFDSDMRFMKGRYRGMDGRMYRGTFGFI